MKRHTAHRWLNKVDDGLYDKLSNRISYKMLDRLWDVLDPVFGWAHRVVCSFQGHDIDNDMCGLPEHRLCFGCNRRFPNAIVRGKLTNDR